MPGIEVAPEEVADAIREVEDLDVEVGGPVRQQPLHDLLVLVLAERHVLEEQLLASHPCVGDQVSESQPIVL